MKQQIVVGLGNPGIRYQNTLHNIGYRIVEQLAASLALTWRLEKQAKAELAKGENLVLVKPLSYMNLSGEPVRQLLDYYGWTPEQLLIVTDDADLPLGEIRYRKSGSSGGHNGLKSIEEAIKTNGYKRLKFGIGHPRDQANEKPGQTLADYVLEIQPLPFWEALAPRIDEAVQALKQNGENNERRKTSFV
jgi:PTH1 family peptidyl-tRNA hydrolase